MNLHRPTEFTLQAVDPLPNGESGDDGGERPRPQFSLPSLAESVWKQKIAIVVIWALISAVAVAVVRMLPPIYEAEALVLLESQRIPQDFVNPTTVRADLWERLNTLDQRVLSHTQLVALIQTFGLYREEAKKLNQEELVERMRKDIKIELEPGLGASNRPPAFRVSYQGAHPEEVAQVANRLAYLFIDQDLRERSAEAVGTAEFLESRLEDARKQLETQEGKLSRYKTEHNGELPEQESALLGSLARMQTQLQANQEAVRQAEQDKGFTRNALDEAISAMQDFRALMNRKDPSTGAPVIDPDAGDPNLKAIRDLKRQLVDLRQRYTNNHPEVIKAETALRQLEATAAQESSAPSPDPKPNIATPANTAVSLALEPELRRRDEQVRSLQAQLQSLDNRIRALQQSQERLSKDISAAEYQVQRMPIREQEIASLVRDYEITKANYQTLLKKRMDADMATEMEKRQKSEKFVLLDAARVPAEPIKPKVMLLSLAGSAFGLLLGIVLGVGREMKNNVLLGEWELPKDLQIMGRVPEFSVGDAARTASQSRRAA